MTPSESPVAMLRRAATRTSFVGLIVTLALALSGWVHSASARDYLILLDTSGSMVGKPAGETPNIFPEVKTAVTRYIDQVELGSRVVVMPFHQGVVDRLDVVIRGESDRARVRAYVRGLDANGQSTWIYRSMRSALARAKELRSSTSQEADALQMVLLYTDGRDNGPDGSRLLADILRDFDAQRGDFPHLYLKYVTLGVDVPQDLRKAFEGHSGRELIENKSGALRPLAFVELRPSHLNLGSFAESDQCTREIELAPIGLNRALTAGDVLDLSVSSRDLEAQGAFLTVEPKRLACDKASQTLRFVLHNRAGLKRDEFQAQLVVASPAADLKPLPETLQLTLSTEPSPGVTLRAADGGALPGSLGPVMPDDPRELALRVDVIGKLECAEIAVRGDLWRDDQRLGPVAFEGGTSPRPGVITLSTQGGGFSTRIGAGLAPGAYRVHLQVVAGPGDRIQIETPDGTIKSPAYDVRFEVPQPGLVVIRTSAAEPLPVSLGDLPYQAALRVPLRAEVAGGGASAGPIRVRAETWRADRTVRDVPLEGGTLQRDGSIVLPPEGGEFAARLESGDAPGDYSLHLEVSSDARRVIQFETPTGPVKAGSFSMHFRVPEPPMEISVRRADGSPLLRALGSVTPMRPLLLPMRLAVRRPSPVHDGLVVRAEVLRGERAVASLPVAGGSRRSDGSTTIPKGGGEFAVSIDPARMPLGAGRYTLQLTVLGGPGSFVRFETDSGPARTDSYGLSFEVPFRLPLVAWIVIVLALLVAGVAGTCRTFTESFGRAGIEYEGRIYPLRPRWCFRVPTVGGAGASVFIQVLPPGVQFEVRRGSPGTIAIVPRQRGIRDGDRDLPVGVRREFRDGGVIEVGTRRLIVRIRVKMKSLSRTKSSPEAQPPTSGR